MLDNITVVVCSREDENTKKEFVTHVSETCGYSVHIIFLINKDGVSLTEVYSDIMKDIKTDIVIFIHDDIEFLRKGWGKEIVRLFETHQDYSIIGIAGSAEFDERGAWWNYKNIYGQVLHRNNGKSWLTAFSPLFDKDLEEVCVIDGLFMAVHLKRLSEGFDVEFTGFNHYDTSFSISNYIDGKYKIGVTTNIRVAHNSIGETKQNWYDNLKLLNDKYKKYYPLNVQNDKKRRNEQLRLQQNNSTKGKKHK